MIYKLQAYIMELMMKAAKWGNSLAVRLPKDVIEALGISEGSELRLRRTENNGFILDRVPTLQEDLIALRRLRGRMPVGFKFDREEANSRGDD